MRSPAWADGKGAAYSRQKPDVAAALCACATAFGRTVIYSTPINGTAKAVP
jgi:hypothetical protein